MGSSAFSMPFFRSPSKRRTLGQPATPTHPHSPPSEPPLSTRITNASDVSSSPAKRIGRRDSMVRSPDRMQSPTTAKKEFRKAKKEGIMSERPKHRRTNSWPASVAPSTEEVQQFAAYLEQSISTGLRADPPTFLRDGREMHDQNERRDAVTLGRLVAITGAGFAPDAPATKFGWQ